MRPLARELKAGKLLPPNSSRFVYSGPFLDLPQNGPLADLERERKVYAHLRHVEQLALRALVISDVLCAEHIRRLTRLDQLQLFPIEKAVLECEHGFAAVVTLDRHADNLVLADILAVAVVLPFSSLPK